MKDCRFIQMPVKSEPRFTPLCRADGIYRINGKVSMFQVFHSFNVQGLSVQVFTRSNVHGLMIGAGKFQCFSVSWFQC
jgi:hypothetical protein